jgi:hypothetical protein
MNVNDVEGVPEPTKCRLEMIFDRQSELHDKYKVIEGKIGLGHGLIQSGMFNIDHQTSQYYMKDMCWRVTEELAEAYEAFEEFIHKPSNKEAYTHGIEELSDALHFLVEALIICGFVPEDVMVLYYKEKKDRLDLLWDLKWRAEVEMTHRVLSLNMIGVIKHLGLAANCLKNKPWKQSQMITDHGRFKRHMCEALSQLIYLFKYCRVSSQGIYEIYFKKSEVNKFRQRSMY